LKRETGGNTVEYNGVSGQVVPHRLSSGLVDNVISAVRDDADKEAAAYKLLLPLIDITGREYRVGAWCSGDGKYDQEWPDE
jgi:hypothetical protein